MSATGTGCAVCPPVDESTERLVERFLKHVSAIERANAGRLGLSQRLRFWHMTCARGLRSILTERALAGDDAAGNAALGAPHFLTFSPFQVRAIGASLVSGSGNAHHAKEQVK